MYLSVFVKLAPFIPQNNEKSPSSVVLNISGGAPFGVLACDCGTLPLKTQPTDFSCHSQPSSLALHLRVMTFSFEGIWLILVSVRIAAFA